MTVSEDQVSVRTRSAGNGNQALNQADNPTSKVVRFGPDRPLLLDSGHQIDHLQIAYQTYGTLDEDKANAILICHALTGDQHAANSHPVTGKPGWWSEMVGPGRPIDTDRFFVICSNVVGGCMGTTGPASVNPETGQPYGLDLPVITIRDMIRAQAMLVDSLGIETLFSVAGGSMGGMQVLQWAATYPERVFSALPIAAGARHSAQNIAFHEVGRQAVMADPDWRNGRYLVEQTSPRKGLAVARMAAHITYLSDDALHRKFGRNFQDRERPTFGFDADFQIESYLAAPGFDLRRPVRRQFLSLHDAGDGLFRSRQGLWRTAGECLSQLADALLRRLLHLRLALPDLGEQGGRAGTERRRRQRLLCRDRDRSRP